jgi:hypothetical protein
MVDKYPIIIELVYIMKSVIGSAITVSKYSRRKSNELGLGESLLQGLIRYVQRDRTGFTCK